MTINLTWLLAAILKCFQLKCFQPLTVLVAVAPAPILFNHIIPHDRIVEFIPLNSMEFWMDPFKFDRLAKFKAVSYCT
jgi:hypothetical protein